jgi:hypothetical protein
VSNPRWPIEVYAQDLNKAIPASVQIAGGVPILQKSFNNQPFNPTNDGGEAVIQITGSYIVQTTDSLVVVNLAAPGTVTLFLPAAGDRNGLILGIADWAGNATINLSPSPGEYIMGLATVAGLPAGVAAQLQSAAQGLGTGVSVYLRPISSLSGWVNV